MLTLIDFGPDRCIAVFPFEDTDYGCVLCPGHREDETDACLCDCHTDGVDILTFITAHTELLEVMASSWHDSEMACGKDLSDDELRAQMRLMIQVPAASDMGCECGSNQAISVVADSLAAMAKHYGPDHEVTRRIACTWSGSPAFNPLWAV